jgi:hypothetical protein
MLGNYRVSSKLIPSRVVLSSIGLVSQFNSISVDHDHFLPNPFPHLCIMLYYLESDKAPKCCTFAMSGSVSFAWLEALDVPLAVRSSCNLQHMPTLAVHISGGSGTSPISGAHVSRPRVHLSRLYESTDQYSAGELLYLVPASSQSLQSLGDNFIVMLRMTYPGLTHPDIELRCVMKVS